LHNYHCSQSGKKKQSEAKQNKRKEKVRRGKEKTSEQYQQPNRLAHLGPFFTGDGSHPASVLGEPEEWCEAFVVGAVRV
jgi:hypothetical protein